MQETFVISARFRRTPPAVHEIKHDGFRTLARKQGERGEVWSRYRTDFTAKFLTIAAAVAPLPAEDALIDGEAVAFLPAGHSDFAALRTKAAGGGASYVAFDLLSLEGKDLRQRPLEERREALSRLVRGVTSIQFSQSVAGEGRPYSRTPASLASRASCRSAPAAAIGAGRVRTG